MSFKQIERKRNEFLDGDVITFIHDKTKTKLIWFLRDDDNMSFAITFKTPPQDDTGVFHILEHSVLCGSRKYNLKEPFVTLLKNSSQTFLNAMTFPDKTMYPISSRNKKDFLNLVDVYMDAVLHPLIYDKEAIFLQEGHRLVKKDDSVEQNGVVFNEMKGVFSSPENQLTYECSKRLFPDTCYRFESGGLPEKIGDLTYEQFLDTHKKYYHPSNATIFLDGNVDIDATFALLDSYLDEFDFSPCDIQITPQKPVTFSPVTLPYIAKKEDDPKNEICIGFVTADFCEREKQVALDILESYLTGSNEAPLKSALLKRNLCEDIYFESNDEILQRTTFLVIRGVSEENTQKAINCVFDTLKQISKDGLLEDSLLAAFNSYVFSVNEKDFGRYPAGIIYAMNIFKTELYGGEAFDAFLYPEIFAKLKPELKTDYFKSLLDTCFLNSNHTGTVILTPSFTLKDENEKKEKERLKSLFDKMSEKEKDQIDKKCDILLEYQNKADTKEELSKLPHIDPKDLSCEPIFFDCQKSVISDTEVLNSTVKTNDITYAELYFNLDGLTKDELFFASIFSDVFSSFKTKNHSNVEMTNLIMTYLGSFSTALSFVQEDDPKDATPYLVLSTSALDFNKQKLIEILKESVTELVIDPELLKNVLTQRRLSLICQMKENGNKFAQNKAAASFRCANLMREITSGEASLKSLDKAISGIDKTISILLDLKTKIFSKTRLKAGFIGKKDEEFFKNVISIFPENNTDTKKQKFNLLDKSPKSVDISSSVTYAAKCFLSDKRSDFDASIVVASDILSLEFLWNEVRMKGGAYGVNCNVERDGMITMSTFRDPSGEASLLTFDKCADFLEEFLKSDESISGFIIGTISKSEPVLTPYAMGKSAISCEIEGVTRDEKKKNRLKILNTTKSDIKALIHHFREFKDGGVTCIFA